jgi:8-oxo-dGTP diphosphatase
LKKPNKTKLSDSGASINITRKHLQVTCAIIERDGLVLAAQRNAASSMPLKWEFPGGKIDPGETPEQCLLREILEELCIRVKIIRALPASSHEYPAFYITLYPFVCSVLSGNIMLSEHAQVAWLAPRDLFSLDWANADVAVLGSYVGSL